MNSSILKPPLSEGVGGGFSASDDLHRVNRANQPAGIAFNAEVGDDFVLFVRFEQNGVRRAFLRTFGTADAQIIDLIFDQALAFS